VAAIDDKGRSALLIAAMYGKIAMLQWLLSEGGSKISETSQSGAGALQLSAINGETACCQWLLEFGGSCITEASNSGFTMWDWLSSELNLDEGENMLVEIAFFRVVVLQGDPPPIIMAREMAVEIAAVLQEGSRLRERLPAYLAQRRSLFNECCPLIADLQDEVYSYLVPASTEELWATGLGENPLHASADQYSTPF
jgi:hypothetical protein